ncbi:threonine/serine exporter family protein [Variovorax sp. GT1P44]|uniref:threonine/serine exporter family protein n=1 Tax=Variovorax sp. GT1P44 TaxID=3443742 RepID=UPI003F45BE78
MENVALVLYRNGEDTEDSLRCAEALSRSLHVPVSIDASWGKLIINGNGATGARSVSRVVDVLPISIGLNRVAAVRRTVDDLISGRARPRRAASAIQSASAQPPSNVFLFATACVTGGLSLAFIFGARQWQALTLLAISCAIGAFARRWLASLDVGAVGQAFGAALVAGLIGAAAVRLHVSSELRLVAVCACMLLVPGPHILNGSIDVTRLRIPLGLARLTFAALIVIGICAGLLLGLSLGGADLSPSTPGREVSLWIDVPAAGVAAASYCIFFSMPFRFLYWPVVIGMLAHGARWYAMSSLGLNAPEGAGIACLVVSSLTAPLAPRLGLPFAGVTFASVVSLIPGLYMFRFVGGLMEPTLTPAVLEAIVADITTATLVVIAMTVGLVLPKRAYEHWQRLATDRVAK